MFKLKVESRFSAAHHLVDYPGVCQRIHGHNYRVLLTVTAAQLDGQGMIVDLMVVKGILEKCIKQFDHDLINNVPPFDRQNPTMENLAKYIYDWMKKELQQKAKVIGVELWESDDFSVEYSG